MKRYLLFAGDEYYPVGGWGDFKGDFDLIEQATGAAYQSHSDWWQIVDTRTKEIAGEFPLS